MKILLEALRTRLRSTRTPPLPDESEVMALIASIRAANLSYCGKPKLENIAQVLISLRKIGVRGGLLEAGVALGGSAILLGRLKAPGTRLDLFDVFSMIPAPGQSDGEDAHQRYAEIRTGQSRGLGGELYYGYIDDLLTKVRDNLRRFDLHEAADDIHFHPGLFEDTLHPEGPIALAHVDCDWYDSVKVCIERIAPRLAVGGVIIFDDYSSYSGCRKAVDEWLAGAPHMEVLFHQRSLAVRRRSMT